MPPTINPVTARFRASSSSTSSSSPAQPSSSATATTSSSPSYTPGGLYPPDESQGEDAKQNPLQKAWQWVQQNATALLAGAGLVGAGGGGIYLLNRNKGNGESSPASQPVSSNNSTPVQSSPTPVSSNPSQPSNSPNSGGNPVAPIAEFGKKLASGAMGLLGGTFGLAKNVVVGVVQNGVVKPVVAVKDGAVAVAGAARDKAGEIGQGLNDLNFRDAQIKFKNQYVRKEVKRAIDSDDWLRVGQLYLHGGEYVSAFDKLNNIIRTDFEDRDLRAPGGLYLYRALAKASQNSSDRSAYENDIATALASLEHKRNFGGFFNEMDQHHLGMANLLNGNLPEALRNFSYCQKEIERQLSGRRIAKDVKENLLRLKFKTQALLEAAQNIQQGKLEENFKTTNLFWTLKPSVREFEATHLRLLSSEIHRNIPIPVHP